MDRAQSVLRVAAFRPQTKLRQKLRPRVCAPVTYLFLSHTYILRRLYCTLVHRDGWSTRWCVRPLVCQVLLWLKLLLMLF